MREFRPALRTGCAQNDGGRRATATIAAAGHATVKTCSQENLKRGLKSELGAYDVRR